MAENINQTISELSAQISLFADAFEKCCQAEPGNFDDEPFTGEVSVGEGEQFPSTSTYLVAKCNAANAIYDTLLNISTVLDQQDIVGKASAGFGMAGILFGLVALIPPVGWAIVGATGGIVSIALQLETATVDFSNILANLDDKHEDLVNALYNGDSAEEANQAFLDVIDTASPGLTSAERFIVARVLTYKAANQLFEPRDDIAVYQSPDPVNCSSGDCIWQWGTLVSGGQAGSGNLEKETTQTLVAAYDAGLDRYYIRFNAEEIIEADCNLEFTVNSVTFSSGELVQWQILLDDDVSYTSFTYGQIGSAARCARAVDFAASVPWSMSIDFGTDCIPS